MHPALFVQCGDRLGARDFSARGAHGTVAQIQIQLAENRFHKFSAIVDLSDHAVGPEAIIFGIHRCGPFERTAPAAGI